jgi:hypothetical protein
VPHLADTHLVRPPVELLSVFRQGHAVLFTSLVPAHIADASLDGGTVLLRRACGFRGGDSRNELASY